MARYWGSVFFLLWHVVTVLCNPANIVTEPSTAPNSGMRWTGYVFPDKPMYTFVGDAKEIYKAILALNPDYPSFLASLSEQEFSVNSTDGLDDAPSHPDGESYCARSPTGNRTDLDAAVKALSSLGGYCGAPARTCLRMTCENTSGTYICNDNDIAANMLCARAADYVSNAIFRCCQGSVGVSGQIWTEVSNVNIWGSYSECDSPVDKAPADYGPSPGPNGRCIV